MTKKIFAISTLLLVLVIGALFVYNFIFKKSSSKGQETPIDKTAEEGKINQSSSPKNTKEGEASWDIPIKAISDEPVFGAALSADGKSLYYFAKSNGQLNQIDPTGKLIKVISTEQFSDLKKVIWNGPKNKVIIRLETESGKSKFLFFDIAAHRILSLKENIDSITWSNQGDKIIYKFFDPKTKKRTVSIADPDGKNWRDLAGFDYHEVAIASVPNSPEISFWPAPNAFTATSLNTINFSGENKKEILKDHFGTDILWSPDGKQAIASCSDQRGGHKMDLFLMNSQGGQFQTLMFPTFASKCVWSSDSKNLYCALPGNIPESAILPNDWQEGRSQTSDTFWKVDPTSGKKDRLVEAEKITGSFDVLNPFLSADEKALFFTNKSDGKLYRMDF